MLAAADVNSHSAVESNCGILVHVFLILVLLVVAQLAFDGISRMEPYLAIHIRLNIGGT